VPSWLTATTHGAEDLGPPEEAHQSSGWAVDGAATALNVEVPVNAIRPTTAIVAAAAFGWRSLMIPSRDLSRR
jgi:hypothetical protein